MIIENLTQEVFHPVTLAITFEDALELRMMKDFLAYRLSAVNGVFTEGTNSHKFIWNLLTEVSKVI